MKKYLPFLEKLFFVQLKKGYKDFINVSLSSYFSRGIGLIISVVLARYLGPSKFGVYSFGFFVMMIIMSNGMAGIDQSFVYLVNKGKYKNNEIKINYVFLKLLIAFFTITVFFILYLLSQYTHLMNIKNIGVILIALIGGVGNVLFSIIIVSYQGEEKFTQYSRAQILFSSLNLVLVLVGVFLRIKIIGYFLFIYNISGVVIAYYFRNIDLNLSRIRLNIAKEFLIFGKWLILYNLLRVLNYRLDFFILSKYTTNNNLGIYSAALRLANIALLSISIFSVILLPKATKIKNKMELKKFWNIYKKITIFLFFVITVMFVLSRYIILLVYGVNYIHSVTIFQILLISSIPVIFQVPFKNLFISFDNSKYLFLLTAMETVIMLVFSIPIMLVKPNILVPPISKIIACSISLIGYVLIYNWRKPKFKNKRG